MLDESLAVDFLAARQEEGFAFLSSHQGHEALRPSDAATSDIVTLIRMACDAYLLRATQDPPPSSTVPRVEAFINLVTAADAHTDRFGAHITAWACFIMAAESSTGEHRAFFRARFARLLAATGCLNIAVGHGAGCEVDFCHWRACAGPDHVETRLFTFHDTHGKTMVTRTGELCCAE